MSSKATEHPHWIDRIETTASHKPDSLQHHKHHIVCSQIDPHLSHTSYNKSKLKLRHSTITTSPTSIVGEGAEGGTVTAIADSPEFGLNCKSNVNLVNNNPANHNINGGSSSIRYHNHQHPNQHLHHHQVTSKSASAHSSPKLSMCAHKNSLAIAQVESPTSCEIIHMHHTDQLHHQPQTTSGAVMSSYSSKPMLSMSSSTMGTAVPQQSSSGGSRLRHKDPASISMAMAAGPGSGAGLSTGGISVSSGLGSSGILERSDYATSSFTTNIDALTNAIRNKIIVEEDEEDILSCKSASHPY